MKIHKNTSFWLIIIIIFLVVNFLVINFHYLQTWLEIKFISYTNKLQAVYLDNEQALYGKIVGITGDFIKIKDVYYLQSIGVEGQEPTVNLIKRGLQEVTKPENALFINLSQVLYWENIGENSQVWQVIKNTNN